MVMRLKRWRPAGERGAPSEREGGRRGVTRVRERGGEGRSIQTLFRSLVYSAANKVQEISSTSQLRDMKVLTDGGVGRSTEQRGHIEGPPQACSGSDQLALETILLRFLFCISIIIHFIIRNGSISTQYIAYAEETGSKEKGALPLSRAQRPLGTREGPFCPLFRPRRVPSSFLFQNGVCYHRRLGFGGARPREFVRKNSFLSSPWFSIDRSPSPGLQEALSICPIILILIMYCLVFRFLLPTAAPDQVEGGQDVGCGQRLQGQEEEVVQGQG
jgi:hypothetical protein